MITPLGIPTPLHIRVHIHLYIMLGILDKEPFLLLVAWYKFEETSSIFSRKCLIQLEHYLIKREIKGKLYSLLIMELINYYSEL